MMRRHQSLVLPERGHTAASAAACSLNEAIHPRSDRDGIDVYQTLKPAAMLSQ